MDLSVVKINYAVQKIHWYVSADTYLQRVYRACYVQGHGSYLYDNIMIEFNYRSYEFNYINYIRDRIQL